MLIAVVTETTHVTTTEVGAYCAAQYKQFRYHFSPAWSMSTPAVIAYPTAASVPAGAQLLFLRDRSDQPGALAYHTEIHGQKASFVFVETLRAAGLAWTSGASHEALEMRGDESCNRYCDDGNGKLYALEVCDPVESDTYTIDSVVLSDFVHPAWFDPDAPSATRTRHVIGKPNLRPFQLAKGGYAIVDGNPVFADEAARERRALKGGGGHSRLR